MGKPACGHEVTGQFLLVTFDVRIDRRLGHDRRVVLGDRWGMVSMRGRFTSCPLMGLAPLSPMRPIQHTVETPST